MQTDEVKKAIKYKILPTPGRILVRVMSAAEMTAGGIWVVEREGDPPTQGEVVAIAKTGVDEEEKDIVPLFVVGDRVIFGRYMGTKVTMGRETFILMYEKDVMGHLIPDEDGELTDKIEVVDR